MAKILVVDDEAKIREVIREYSEFSGHDVTEAEDGQIAFDLCAENDYDLIIMDIMMPNMDGFTACDKIKKIKNIPVIILSARGEEYDILSGFELGIDDYVIKPFSPKELMARVTAILARNSVDTHRTEELIFKHDNDDDNSKGLVINMAARTVTVDGNKIELTPKEYDLLFYLVENKNVALSRDQLLLDIWGYEYNKDDRTVDTHIKNLRSNLGDYRYRIATMRGVGYKFED